MTGKQFIDVPRVPALHIRDERSERLRKVTAINHAFERLQRSKNMSDVDMEEAISKSLRDAGIKWDFDANNRPLWTASIVED